MVKVDSSDQAPSRSYVEGITYDFKNCRLKNVMEEKRLIRSLTYRQLGDSLFPANRRNCYSMGSMFVKFARGLAGFCSQS